LAKKQKYSIKKNKNSLQGKHQLENFLQLVGYASKNINTCSNTRKFIRCNL